MQTPFKPGKYPTTFSDLVNAAPCWKASYGISEGIFVHGTVLVFSRFGINDFNWSLFREYEGKLIFEPVQKLKEFVYSLFMFKFGTCKTSLMYIKCGTLELLFIKWQKSTWDALRPLPIGHVSSLTSGTSWCGLISITSWPTKAYKSYLFTTGRAASGDASCCQTVFRSFREDILAYIEGVPAKLRHFSRNLFYPSM